MYQSTTAYGELIQQSSRTFKAKITINDTFSITEGIKSIKHHMSSMAADTFSIGSTVSQYVEVEMGVTEVPIENQSVSVLEGMGDEWIPMGEFTAERPKVDEETVTFTAYDNMMKTETPFFADLPDETTTIAVLDKIAEISGVTIITAGLASYAMKKPSGHTCRELLGLIAQLYGCFAICNRNGQIQLKWYEDTGFIVSTDRYFDTFTHNDYPYEFQRIVCTTGEDEEGKSTTIESGSGVREMVLSNPYMTKAQLDVVAEKLRGFSFMPGSVKFLGDNRLDPWDIIAVEDRNGNSYKVPCMKMTHEWDGGMTTEVQAVGESETEQSYDYKGPMTQQMERMEYEFLAIKQEYVLDSKIVHAQIEDLDATTANIKLLLAGSVSAGDLQTIVLNSRNVTIADATIKSAMIESLQFDKITGFEVNTSKMNVHSDDGKSVWADNTIQISDANRTRVQIGKDASGDYSIYIWDKDGNLMFDPLGLTASGVNRPIIRDDMVADDAAINGKKLDIESVAKEVNESGVTLKSTVIKFDSTGQTLDAAFNTLTTSVDGSIRDQTTAINVMQGQVSGIISDNEQIKGDMDTMRTRYNEFSVSVSGMQATISDHTSLLNEQGEEIKTTSSKIAEYQATLDTFSVNLSNMQTELNGKVSSSQMTSAINAKAGEITATVSASYATKSDLSSTNSRVGSLETWKNSASLKITDSAIISTVTGSSEFSNAISSKVTQTMNSYTIKASQIKLEGYVTANGTFQIDTSGSLNCIGGKIGGFTIGSARLYAGSSSYGYVAVQAGTSSTAGAFAAGMSSYNNFSDAKFRVRMDGKMFATDAVISGSIEATSGSNKIILSDGKISFGYGSSANAYIKGYSNSSSMIIKSSFLQIEVNSISFEFGGVGYAAYSGTKNGLTFKNGICVS